MSFRSNSRSRAKLYSSFFILAAGIGFSFAFLAPAARADGDTQGYAFCSTFGPTSQYYVPGDPVYFSQVFHVTSQSGYDRDFKNFLRQKHGWTKNVTCFMSWTSEGANKTFNENLGYAGSKAVRTGWTLGSGGTSTGSPSSPAMASDPAEGNEYWVCRVSGADGKDYNSDIFRGSPAGVSTFPNSFGQFVQMKYKVKFQSPPTCTDYGVLGQQQALDALKGFASYGTGVMTGWKYAAGSSAPGVQATAAPASNGIYWVCQLNYYQKNYVSAAILVSAEESQGGDMGRLNRDFRTFLETKYGLKPHVGGGSCLPQGSGTQAEANVQRWTSTQGGVATSWKPGSASDAGSALSLQTTTENPSGAASANSQASGMMYWVCTWGNTNGTMYISDEFAAGTFAGNQVGPTELVPPFTSFVIAKFGATPHAGSANCIYKFTEADAQTYLHQRISKPPSGMHVVQTGWKYGMTDSGGAAPEAPAATAAAIPGAVPAQREPPQPVTMSISVRLIDAVNSSTDPAGKRYRAVVTKEASAGGVQIPQNTPASITLAQQTAGTFSAQLVALKLNGQELQVSSTAVTATSMVQQAQQAAKKVGGFLSSFGKQSVSANQSTSSISAAGNHVAIPPGTSLTFSTSVLQPGVPVTSAPPPQSNMPAASSNQGDEQQNGERGPDGQIIGGTTSGLMTAYYCTAEAIPPGKHRQTTYVTAPFNSAQPQRWITFWFSQHIHQTYNIPSNVANYTVGCNTFGNKTPAQQQAAVNADISRWKERNDDVVQLNWVPTQTPTPGVSVGQLNNMTGQIVTGGIGSNLPPHTNPAGSVALCAMSSSDGRQFISSIFAADNHDHSDFDIAFANHLSTKYLNGKPMGNGGCQIVTPAHAQAMLQQWKKDYAAHNISYVDTGWSYQGPEAGPVQIAQTSPPGYILCMTNTGNGKAYTSAIFKENEEALAIEQAFNAYLATNYGEKIPHNTSCMKNRYIEDPQRYLYAMKNQAPGNGIKIIETGWTYKGAESVTAANAGSGDADPGASAGGQYVLCYSDANQSPLYLSANFHIDVPPAPGAQSGHTDNGRSANAIADLTQEFVRFLQKQYGYRSAISIPGYCDGSASSTKPDEERQVLHERFSKLKMIETGWKPGATPPPVAASISTAPANPYSSVGGVYTGTYTCAKGPVDMKLKLSLNENSILNGTMTFYLPPGSHTKAYTFSLGGPLNQSSGSFNLRPMKWEGAEPPNYVMVGLKGTADPKAGRVSGTIDYSGCGRFEAMKGRED